MTVLEAVPGSIMGVALIYWIGGRPSWSWKYVKSGTLQPTDTYCVYP